jgi:hypothetical protein
VKSLNLYFNIKEEETETQGDVLFVSGMTVNEETNKNTI